MDVHALADAVRPASAEEAPLLREVLDLYGRALDGQFHLLPALQEKGRRLSPATLATLDRALRVGAGGAQRGWRGAPPDPAMPSLGPRVARTPILGLPVGRRPPNR